MIDEFGPDDGVVHYAIGDVHGFLPQMSEALSWCAEDADSAGMRGIVHLLGDYVDRGPDSREVIEVLMKGSPDRHVEWRPLRGNHDDVFARTWRDPEDAEAAGWWEHGGQQTLASYGWNPLLHDLPDTIGEWVPAAHAEFLLSLPLVATTPDAIFVHAGLRPGVALADQTPRDLMWIRSTFTKSAYDFGRPVVHGHTPESENPKQHANRVALDSGCFIGGVLSAAAFDPGSREPRFMRFGPNGRIRELSDRTQAIKC